MANLDKLLYCNLGLTWQIHKDGPNSQNDSDHFNIPGQLMIWKGNIYRYVQFDNGTANVAAVANGVVHWKASGYNPATGLWTVTSDQTDAAAGITSVAGILGGVVTDQYWTWIQVGGYAYCKVAALTAVGDWMIAGTTDLTFDRIAANAALTAPSWGTAVTAIDGNNKAYVILRNLL